MKTFWITLAIVAMSTAGYFLLRRDIDKAFVVAALGGVAWFLNYRTQLREITAKADRDKDLEKTDDESNEDLKNE